MQVQGYLFSRPIPAAGLPALLKQLEPRAPAHSPAVQLKRAACAG